MGKSAYEEAITNKQLAAKILVPLIEFEFAFLGDDAPMLVQSRVNESSIDAIFQVCRHHGWTTSSVLLGKGRSRNPYFRLSATAFREIYAIAGPFADKRKHRWAQLIVERRGNIGGYRKNDQQTTDKVLTLMLTNANRFWTTYELCLELRLLPSGVRAALRKLYQSQLVERRRKGKTVSWKAR